MNWTVELPGAPPSGNHAYRIVRISPRGKPAFLSMAKTAEAEAYQLEVAYRVKLARPRGWKPSGKYVRIYYDFYLRREIDVSDNAQKILNDALKHALGIDDRFFLTCVRSKHVGPTESIRVTAEIGDEHDNT